MVDGTNYIKRGQYAVFDLGEETTGQIFFDITAENAAENAAETPDGNAVYVGYGEDFKGRVHAYINGRNFAFSYNLNGGENKFVQPFGRMGGRYLVLFALCDISVREIGVSEIGYPVTKKELSFKDPLDQKFTTWRRGRIICACTRITRIARGASRLFTAWMPRFR